MLAISCFAMDERLRFFLWVVLGLLSFKLGVIHSSRVKLETKYVVVATMAMIGMQAARMTSQRRW